MRGVEHGFTVLDCGSDSKESACNAGDLGLVPELGRSPGRGHGSPLQYSCLENPMDRGAWRLKPIGPQRAGHDWGTGHTAWFLAGQDLE